MREIGNWIKGKEQGAASGGTFEKRSPHDNALLYLAVRSKKADVDLAVRAARDAQPEWNAVPPVQRGHLLHQICNKLEANQQQIADIVAAETGKTPAEAFGETGGAIALGRFFAGEGQRLYGRTTTSGTAHKQAMTVRQPCGVAGLIVPANTPIANVAWKSFPALICGNAVVLKSAEDTPATASIFTQICHDAGLPAGVLNLVHGIGDECGRALVEHDDVDIISFTGSTKVGRWIGETCGRKLRKVSLELGGKNPLVVADDADLDKAVKWVCLSAYSNAGQRCASASRVIVFDSVYDAFRAKLISAAEKLKIGPENGCDFGPVINERQLKSMLGAIDRAKAAGAKVLTGGHRLTSSEHQAGWYIAPTVIEGAEPDAEISQDELFGPVLCLYRVPDFAAAVRLCNDSPFGLTACIHTASFDRAMTFTQAVKSGVVVVNAGTFGSEPHMPFGGLRGSGNGTREPGTEALDVYSEIKDVYLQVSPERL